MIDGKKLYFPMKQLFSCLGIQYHNGIKALDRLDLFPKIGKKYSPGVDFVLKAKPLYIASQGLWMLSFI
jgi:hypothetical protein